MVKVFELCLPLLPDVRPPRLPPLRPPALGLPNAKFQPNYDHLRTAPMGMTAAQRPHYTIRMLLACTWLQHLANYNHQQTAPKGMAAVQGPRYAVHLLLDCTWFRHLAQLSLTPSTRTPTSSTSSALRCPRRPNGHGYPVLLAIASCRPTAARQPPCASGRTATPGGAVR